MHEVRVHWLVVLAIFFLQRACFSKCSHTVHTTVGRFLQGVSEGRRAYDKDFTLHKAEAEAAELENVGELARLIRYQGLEIGNLFDDGEFNFILVVRGQKAERGLLKHNITVVLDDPRVCFFQIANREFPVRQCSCAAIRCDALRRHDATLLHEHHQHAVVAVAGSLARIVTGYSRQDRTRALRGAWWQLQ